MQKSKRVLSLLLTLALCLGLLAISPITAHAGSVTADYTLYLNYSDGTLRKNNSSGEDITVAMAGAGAVVSGSADARVLTLTNFNFATTADDALWLPSGSTLVLSGTNTITTTDTSSSIALYMVGNSTITGDGSLVATGGTATGAGDASIGIAAGGLIISGGATVTATGGDDAGSIGIYINGYMSNLIIDSGSTVTATGNTRAINKNYTVPNGYKYTVSTNANGSSPTTGTSDGSFVIDGTYKYIKIDPVKYVGLFGLNTTYPSNFLNWFLFIVCFGFIWMWF